MIERCTEKLANLLRAELTSISPDFGVYCGHAEGTKRTGLIKASLYEKLDSGFPDISRIDVLVTHKQAEEKPLLLSEFERTSSAPKTVLADITSLLIAKYVHLNKLGKHFQLDGTEGLFVSVYAEGNIYAKRKRARDIVEALRDSGMAGVDRLVYLDRSDPDDLVSCTLRQMMAHLSERGYIG